MSLPDRERWQRWSPLLDELLDLEPAARSDRLLDLARHDAALAAELRQLLGTTGDADAAKFLTGSAAHSASNPALVGSAIGKYIIEAPLGEGGTGSVWRARRADGRFEGSVAIKLLHLSLIGREGAHRFEREGAILARLAHQNIARLLDAGVTPGGQPFLVLEFVLGERIDTYCDTRRLGIEQRLALFDSVLAAVAHAHNQLVIHRDIKPSNILVSAEGTVKLLDFGIARLLQEESGDVTQTAEGRRALTLQYASPEQVQGKPVSTATDVYALGVLLYSLLAGRHPMAGNTTTPAQLLRATVETEPLRLSRALVTAPAQDEGSAHQVATDRGLTVARLQRLLEGDLDNIVAQALRKDASQRYQTVGELAEDLRRHRAHQPISARAVSWRYLAAKFLARRRWAVAAAAAVATSLTTGAATAVWKSLEAERRRDEAALQARHATASLDLLNMVMSDAGAMSAQTMPQRLAKVRELVGRSRQDPEVKVLVLERVAARMFEIGNGDDLMTTLDEMHQLTQGMKSPLGYRASVACLRANVLGSLGKVDEADAAMAWVWPVMKLIDDARRRADCFEAESYLARLRGQNERALRAVTSSVDSLVQGGITLDERYASALYQLALVHIQLGNNGFAYEQMLKARSVLNQLGLSGSQDDLNVMVQAAMVLSGSGKPAQAAALLHVLESDPHVAHEHQVSGYYLDSCRGQIELTMGRPVEAVAALERAVTAARAAADHAFAAGPEVLLVDALVAAGRGEEASRRLEAMPNVAPAIQASRPAGARYLATKAGIALAGKDTQRADALARQALAILAAKPFSDSRRLVVLLAAARTAMAVGDLPRAQGHALAAFEQARAEAIDPASSSSVGEALLLQARLSTAQGDAAGASRLAAQALPHLKLNLGEEHASTRLARTLSTGVVPS